MSVLLAGTIGFAAGAAVMFVYYKTIGAAVAKAEAVGAAVKKDL